MKIPINDYKEKLIDQYSIATETETLHTPNETNENYYQSILSKNDIPYFPVREINFQKYPRSIYQMITDIKKGSYSNKNEMKFI
ncbi:unnamed protein product [Adineta steineri]|uniref:Uncharacterized protein n=1 Tax=Adineta steineri TaxID=433720 RepID=A0A814VZE5_9BILA|nr:unnamed protein product [Adineta steineri]